MFCIPKNTELTADLLYKMLSKFKTEVEPKLKHYKKYYDGAQKILQKSYSDPTKPCSKIVTNYCSDITHSYNGYLATPGFISYSSQEDIEEIMDILRYNDYQEQDSAFLLDALIYGVAAELMYFDGRGQTRFRLIDPKCCFGVYDDSLTGDLLYFVRFYKANEWDDSDLYKVDVYNDWTVKHYTMHGQMGMLTYVGEEFHYFSQCPANIFYLPDEKSIFDCILTLQDGVNEVLSSEIDDYSAFCDAYLALTGVDADPEDLAAMKAARAMLLPEGASAQYVTKNVSDVQVENILKRLHDSIYRIAKCPDFSSESFVGGVSSGVAIRYRLTGMETRSGLIEARMKKALQRRVEIICGIASLKLGESIFRDIQIEFKRNIPADVNSTIQMINGLQGIVSNQTLLSLLEFVPDPAAELEKLKEQKEETMALYPFTFNQSEDEQEVEKEA